VKKTPKKCSKLLQRLEPNGSTCDPHCLASTCCQRWHLFRTEEKIPKNQQQTTTEN